MLSDPDCAHPLCRVCFGGAEHALSASGQLISPCSCTGSVKYIHLHCLRTWQATQRAQGRHHRAHCCELCGKQYAIPKKLAQRESDQQTRWQKLQLVLKRIWVWFNSTAQGPMWQEALRYWRSGMLIAGLCKATLYGVMGLVEGGQRGFNSASRGAYCLAQITPGLMMAAMLFPKLQIPLMMGSFLALSGLAASAAVLTLAGAYCGAFYGFCSGALGFVRWVLGLHLDTVTVGYKCTELTVGAVFKIAASLGGRFAAFLGRGMLPL